jgi:hypothetical protein
MSIFRGYVNKFGMYYWCFAKPELPVGGRRLFFFLNSLSMERDGTKREMAKIEM